MDKEEIFERIADSRQALMEAISGLDKETITTANIQDGWTIKDLLAHIIAWDSVCLDPLREFSKEGIFHAEQIHDHNNWNSKETARRAELPIETILRELSRVRLELLSLVERLDESHGEMELSLPWGERGTILKMLDGLASHEEEHTKEIDHWRQTHEQNKS
jgi:uncharacterized damage-inducible protein DinB